jgi:DNA-binding transcriptional ArsR family regulator
VYGALAHETRRRLIQRLTRGPVRVTDLAVGLPHSLAATSRHIKVLEAAGMVDREVIGRDHFLRLDAAPLAGAAAWMNGYRRFWEERVDVLEARLRERGKGRD